jgi:hypothetical protein
VNSGEAKSIFGYANREPSFVKKKVQRLPGYRQERPTPLLTEDEIVHAELKNSGKCPSGSTIKPIAS